MQRALLAALLLGGADVAHGIGLGLPSDTLGVPTALPSPSPTPDPNGSPPVGCSGQAEVFPEPSPQNHCVDSFTPDAALGYPYGFGIANSFKWYECPQSGRRIVIANAIPNHDAWGHGSTAPCVTNWAINLPLNPTKTSTRTEPSPTGLIGIAVNGVPIYGPQNGNGSVVDPPTMVDPFQPYGSTEDDGKWVYRHPYLGNTAKPSSTTLLGYAMDGIPIYGPVTNQYELDECNGRMVGGYYQYHVRTPDQVTQYLNGTTSYCSGTTPAIKYPYIVGCFHGSVASTVVSTSGGANIPNDCVLKSESATPPASPPSPDTPAPTPPSPSPTPAPTPSPTPSPYAYEYPSPTPSPSNSTQPTSNPSSSTIPDWRIIIPASGTVDSWDEARKTDFQTDLSSLMSTPSKPIQQSEIIITSIEPGSVIITYYIAGLTPAEAQGAINAMVARCEASTLNSGADCMSAVLREVGGAQIISAGTWQSPSTWIWIVSFIAMILGIVV